MTLAPGGGIPYQLFEEPKAEILQTFSAPVSPQTVTFISHEVTALCPLTGQPDFYTVEISYVPRFLCVESKSAKLYFGAYRSYKGFIEKVAEKMLGDWVTSCKPRIAKICVTMVPRGGISIKVEQEYNEYP